MTLNSRHILILLGISLAMSSCADFSMQDGKAELYPPVFKVDTHVEEIIQTKGDPGVPPLNVPATQDIHFTVKDKDGNTIYDKQGVWSEALKMPVGSYTVEASYGSNTFGAPYYKGSCSGTIASGKEETPSITMSLCNALLATTLSEDLAVHFKADEVNPVRISTSSSSLDTGLGTYIFAPEGESLTVAISGQSSAGVAKTITHSIAPLTPATASYITCDMTTTNAPKITLSGTAEAWGSVAYIPAATIENISEANVAKMKYYASSDEWATSVVGAVVDGSVKFTGLTPGATYKVRAQIGALNSNEVSITMSTSALSIKTAAAHTKNVGDELDGTDFTASFSVPEKFGITGATISLCKTDGTVLRTTTLTGATADWTSDGSAESAWPYLPKGDYSITGKVTQNGTEINLSEQTMTVPAPTFKVNIPSAHTSYDTYNNSGADAANAEDGSTIYGVTNNGVKIANTILTNANYKSIIGGYTYFIDDKSANEDTNANQSWAAHNVTTKFTFDDVTTESSPLTCHVTGLPYRPSDFTLSGTGNKSETFTFYTPGEIRISCKMSRLSVYSTSLITVEKLTINIGGQDAASYEGPSKFSGGTNTYTDLSIDTHSITNSNSSVIFIRGCTVAGPKINVEGCQLLYR